jgi:tetratricopeptide (TPR) repeat protein
MKRAPRWLLLTAPLWAFGCKGPGGGDSAPPPPAAETAASGGELAGIKAQLASGDADGALQRLAESPSASGPEGLYLQGAAWAKKSETMPLPTPEALPPGSPRGAVPVTPELKPEELKAVDFFEKAIAAAPQDARPQLELAQLLAPHALRRHQAQVAAAAAAAARKPVRGRKNEPPPPPPPGPDVSPASVAKAYRAAVQLAPTNKAALDALYAFAVHTDQLDDAEFAVKQAVALDKENPEPLVRYGDFLAEVRKMPDAAIAQYRQALIWKPDDKVVKAKIGQIYLNRGLAHFQQTEWSLAEAAYREALKWADPGSDLAERIQREMERVQRNRN